MELKEYIRAYREAHDYSQRQFAEVCGLSNGYISMLERGVNPKTQQPVTPTLPVLKKLADGMGITLTTLFAEIDDMPVELDDEIEKPALAKESGLTNPIDLELLDLILRLPQDKKPEACRYLRYLAESADK